MWLGDATVSYQPSLDDLSLDVCIDPFRYHFFPVKLLVERQ